MAEVLAQVGETSSSSPSPLNPINGKPVIVRVKRKASQARLDAFWLEINERPRKRPFLDLANLSLDDSDSGKVLEEFGMKKLLVQHLDTVRHSDGIKDVLHSFLQQDSNNSKELKRSEERRSLLKPNKKQGQLRSVARKMHEDIVRNARFEQIWKSRRASIDAEEYSLREICHLYDVVRVDAEDETHGRVHKSEVAPSDDDAIMCNYLPLLREFLPEAALEIESDIMESGEDNYVYDLYTVGNGSATSMEDTTEYPLVQVNDDDDYYDGPLQSEYESDDSNAEDNPRNDYPDEQSSGDEDEVDDPFDYLQGSDSEYEHEEVYIDEDEDNRR